MTPNQEILFDSRYGSLTPDVAEKIRKSREEVNKLKGRELKCPVCGHNYRRQIVNGKAYWVCSYKASGRLECTSERIPEEAAKEAFVRMTDKLVKSREDLLGDLIRQLEKCRTVSAEIRKRYIR